MKLSRKDFLRSSLATLGAATGLASLETAGCGGSEDSKEGSVSSCSSDIVSNHGHVLTVSAADVAAGTTRDYDIHGTADHTHQVTITPLHFADLKQQKLIALTTTTAQGHQHSITVQCS